MAYTPINKSTDYFNTLLYNGNDTADTTITGVGFQSDFTWIKSRLDTENHNLFDAIRGGGYRLYSNLNDAQSYIATTLSSWNSDGFVVGIDDGVNKTNGKFVSWNWKANGLGSSNTDGSINSIYTSASTTSGFSIVNYTGNGTAGATVGHGLGKEVKTIIIKKYNTTSDWVYGSSGMGFTKYMNLNSTSAESAYSGMFNNTAPTSSVFTLGSDGQANASGGTYIAYCFADITGFSKSGSYIGNGNANGTFIYTGFKPAFVIVKASSISNEWNMWDNKRDPINVADTVLWSNTTNTEAEIEDDYKIDILSNGFKARTTDARLNQSGATYIYMAFAGEPLVSTNGNAATAR